MDGTGLAQFVERLPAILRGMLGEDARLPRVIFTDRGTGMYSPQGFVVGTYEAAVADAGVRLFWRPDASKQSPDMPDLLLHETAVAQFRQRIRKEKPIVRPWLETSQQWTDRARKVVQWMNDNYDLEGLCKDFP